MSATTGFSIKIWSGGGSSSSCIIFDNASDSVVDTLLAVLENHGGVGQIPPKLLQRAKKIGCGNEDAMDEVNASSFVPECVQDFLDYPSESTGMKIPKEDFNEDDVKEEPMDEEDMEESEEAVYEVDKVVGKKEIKGQIHYLIKWKGFDKAKDNTWEPEDNLKCTENINKFEAKQKIKSKLVCSMCGFSSNVESDVTDHLESPHDFVCSECDSKFTQATDLFEHKLNKHTFDETDTDIYLPEKEGARKQYRKVCKICKVENMLPDNKKHNTIYHSVSSLFIFPCPQCWEWFPTEDSMKKHTEFHRPGDDSYIYCQVCDMKMRAQFSGSTKGFQRAVTVDGVEGYRTTIGQETLDEHMKIHTDETRTTCGHCGKKCKDHKAYTHHIRLHDEARHACEICGKAFRKVSEVEEHVKVLHTKELEFRCDQCFKSFPSRVSLKDHMKSHNPSRNFQCEKCPKAFKMNKDLVSHDKRVHLKLRPFACSFAGCGIAFATNVDRGIHERIHTGEKPYKCDECGAVFRKWQHWKKHEMLHTGEKPFKCQHCGKGFIQNCNMKMHEVKCSMHS